MWQPGACRPFSRKVSTRSLRPGGRTGKRAVRSLSGRLGAAPRNVAGKCPDQEATGASQFARTCGKGFAASIRVDGGTVSNFFGGGFSTGEQGEKVLDRADREQSACSSIWMACESTAPLHAGDSPRREVPRIPNHGGSSSLPCLRESGPRAAPRAGRGRAAGSAPARELRENSRLPRPQQERFRFSIALFFLRQRNPCSAELLHLLPDRDGFAFMEPAATCDMRPLRGWTLCRAMKFSLGGDHGCE